jgi:hypothetical protein
MKDGNWIDGGQITFCQTHDGRKILVNGYHRLNAIIDAGIPCIFNVRTVHVKSIDDARRVYATFDTMARKRSAGEILRAEGVAEKYGLTNQVADAVFSAAPLLANGMKYRNYQKAPELIGNIINRLNISTDYWVYGKKYQDMTSSATYRHRQKMLVAGVIGVAFITIKHQTAKAEDFWRGVASMENMGADDPRMSYAKLLQEKKYTTRIKDGEVPMPARDAALAWNAFYEGRPLKIFRTNNSQFRLAGCGPMWR